MTPPQKFSTAQVWWLIMPATGEAEIGMITVQVQPWQKASKTGVLLKERAGLDGIQMSYQLCGKLQ
jgi:hypothetical protein